MNFLKSILPSTIPPHLIGETDQQIAKERILQTILLAASLMITGMLFMTSTSIVPLLSPISKYLAPALSLIVVTLTIMRKLPYIARVVPALILIFAIGFGIFLLQGISGAGIGFFIVFTIIAGALLGPKGNAISLIIVIAAFLSLAFGIAKGIIPSSIPIQEPNVRDLSSWMGTFFLMVIALAASTMTTVTLFGGLDNALTRLTHQVSLTDEIQIEKDSLALRVQERTERLDKRAEQLRAIADISRSLSSILDQEIMFQKVVDLLQERMDLYYAGIFIIEETGQFAILKAGTGKAGRQMVSSAHRLQVGGTSMIGWATSNRMAKIALDVGEEAVRFDNPLLPETRSELALPIISRENAIGAITIQSAQPNAFDKDDVLIFQGVADSLSVALENARLFQQTQEDLNEIRLLNQQYLQESWGSFMQASSTLTSEFENPLALKSTEPVYQQTIPITLRNQHVGQIVLETTEDGLSQEDQQFIDAISAQTALSLESARLLRETQRQAIQEEKINEITTQFSNAFDIKGVLQTALRELSQLPSVSEIAVHLVPPESQIETSDNGNEVLK